MTIPKHFEIRIPAMEHLKKNGLTQLRDFVEPLSKHFKLSEEEVGQMYASGQGPIFYDRISWALSYMFLAELVKRPSRAVYQLTERGEEMLTNPENINPYIQKVVERKNKSKKSKQQDKHIQKSDSAQTPSELLSESFNSIKNAIYDEILEEILKKSPLTFEKIVVALMQKMGYGGEIEDAGIVTQASNDGGIDGIIKEDILGLGKIYIQAKRYDEKSGIQRADIQKFVGALAVVQSNKGVFITTSYYSKGAKEYVKNLHGTTNLVLINGRQLAEYIYDFGLGMQVEHTLEIKKIDNDFWEKF